MKIITSTLSFLISSTLICAADPHLDNLSTTSSTSIIPLSEEISDSQNLEATLESIFQTNPGQLIVSFLKDPEGYLHWVFNLNGFIRDVRNLEETIRTSFYTNYQKKYIFPQLSRHITETQTINDHNLDQFIKAILAQKHTPQIRNPLSATELNDYRSQHAVRQGNYKQKKEDAASKQEEQHQLEEQQRIQLTEHRERVGSEYISMDGLIEQLTNNEISLETVIDYFLNKLIPAINAKKHFEILMNLIIIDSTYTQLENILNSIIDAATRLSTVTLDNVQLLEQFIKYAESIGIYKLKPIDFLNSTAYDTHIFALGMMYMNITNLSKPERLGLAADLMLDPRHIMLFKDYLKMVFKDIKDTPSL